MLLYSFWHSASHERATQKRSCLSYISHMYVNMSNDVSLLWLSKEARYAAHCWCFLSHWHPFGLIFGFFGTFLGQLLGVKAWSFMPNIGHAALARVNLGRLLFFTYKVNSNVATASIKSFNMTWVWLKFIFIHRYTLRWHAQYPTWWHVAANAHWQGMTKDEVCIDYWQDVCPHLRLAEQVLQGCLAVPDVGTW